MQLTDRGTAVIRQPGEMADRIATMRTEILMEAISAKQNEGIEKAKEIIFDAAVFLGLPDPEALWIWNRVMEEHWPVVFFQMAKMNYFWRNS